MTIEPSNRRKGEHYRWGDGCEGWHLHRSPQVSVTEEILPPEKGDVMHYHEYARQVFYVLSGRMRMDLADQVVRLRAGDCLVVPPFVQHRICNYGRSPLRILLVSTPSQAADRIVVS